MKKKGKQNGVTPVSSKGIADKCEIRGTLTENS